MTPTPSEIERLIHHMPAVADNAQSTWACGFARSVQKQARRKNWNPSTKQLAVMQKLVADLFAYPVTEEDWCPIEWVIKGDPARQSTRGLGCWSGKTVAPLKARLTMGSDQRQRVVRKAETRSPARCR